jgi:hypothetical protein
MDKLSLPITHSLFNSSCCKKTLASVAQKEKVFYFSALPKKQNTTSPTFATEASKSALF